MAFIDSKRFDGERSPVFRITLPTFRAPNRPADPTIEDRHPSLAEFQALMEKMLVTDDVPALNMTRDERRELARHKRVRAAIYSRLVA